MYKVQAETRVSIQVLLTFFAYFHSSFGRGSLRHNSLNCGRFFFAFFIFEKLVVVRLQLGGVGASQT